MYIVSVHFLRYLFQGRGNKHEVKSKSSQKQLYGVLVLEEVKVSIYEMVASDAMVSP